MRHRSFTLEVIAAEHRASLTPSEAALWRYIRVGRVGVWFKRQVVLGGRVIADFVAPAVRLVVEVDGERDIGRHGAARHGDGAPGRLRISICLPLQPSGWQTTAGQTYTINVTGIETPITYDVTVVDCE